MPLPIDPIEIVNLFNELGIRKRGAMVGYLLSIATAATDLVNCWTRILECRLMMDEAEWEGKRPDRNLMKATGTHQAVFAEASVYYKRASDALGGRLSKTEMDDLFNALVELMHIREETKALFNTPNDHDSEDEALQGRVFMDAIMGRETWQELPRGNASRITLPGSSPEELEREIDEMQREAATLRALAVAVRAQPRRFLWW